MNEKYKLNKEWLDLLLEHKNNANVTFNLSNNDIRILLTYIKVLKKRIDKYIEIIDNLYSKKEISKYQYEKYMSIAKEN